MSLILTAKPAERKMPRNERIPEINPRIQETLTSIGGIVPPSGGPHAGFPVYRLAWGQTETHFCRGKQRLRFPDENIEPVIIQERFFVSPEVFERAALWQEEREKLRLKKFLNCDYSMFAEHQPLSNYLKQHESSLDYMQLEDSIGSREEVSIDVLGIASTVAPKNWLYLCDVKDIIEIGKACFFVLRWIPGSSHGGKTEWNRIRYTMDAFVPELNATVPMVDDLGEFPDYGCYIPRYQVAEFARDDFGNYSQTEFSYAEPSEENCIQPVVEEIYRRETMTKQDKDRGWLARQQEKHLLDKRDTSIAAKTAETNRLLGIDEPPVMGGRIHVFQS